MLSHSVAREILSFFTCFVVMLSGHECYVTRDINQGYKLSKRLTRRIIRWADNVYFENYGTENSRNIARFKKRCDKFLKELRRFARNERSHEYLEILLERVRVTHSIIKSEVVADNYLYLTYTETVLNSMNFSAYSMF